MQNNFLDSEVDDVTHILESSAHMTLFDFFFGANVGFHSWPLLKKNGAA